LGRHSIPLEKCILRRQYQLLNVPGNFLVSLHHCPQKNGNRAVSFYSSDEFYMKDQNCQQALVDLIETCGVGKNLKRISRNLV